MENIFDKIKRRNDALWAALDSSNSEQDRRASLDIAFSHDAWAEYDAAAEYCARRGLKGTYGDPLPMNMSATACRLIDDDVEAFERRVRETAYAIAMEKRND